MNEKMAKVTEEIEKMKEHQVGTLFLPLFYKIIVFIQ